MKWSLKPHLYSQSQNGLSRFDAGTEGGPVGPEETNMKAELEDDDGVKLDSEDMS
jgi:hypothetical protein